MRFLVMTGKHNKGGKRCALENSPSGPRDPAAQPSHWAVRFEATGTPSQYCRPVLFLIETVWFLMNVVDCWSTKHKQTWFPVRRWGILSALFFGKQILSSQVKSQKWFGDYLSVQFVVLERWTFSRFCQVTTPKRTFQGRKWFMVLNAIWGAVWCVLVFILQTQRFVEPTFTSLAVGSLSDVPVSFVWVIAEVFVGKL